MSRFFVLVILLLTVQAYGQTTRLYLNSNSAFTTNNKEAASYVDIEKLGDSAFHARQYLLNDSISTDGYYKDARLTIPHGKFFSYDYSEIPYIYNYKKYHMPRVTVTTVRVGYYTNGVKNGRWRIFANGEINTVETYKDGVLDGFWENFNFGKPFVTGNYVNGRREGAWYVLTYCGDTITKDIYKSGKVLKSISYENDEKFKIHGATPNYNFEKYLNAALADCRFRDTSAHRVYVFKLDTTGKLQKLPYYLTKLSEMDSVIANKIAESPQWIPARSKQGLKEFLLVVPLDIWLDKHGKITVRYNLRDAEQSTYFNNMIRD